MRTKRSEGEIGERLINKEWAPTVTSEEDAPLIIMGGIRRDDWI